MKVLIMSDSFKESLTQKEVYETISETLKEIDKDIDIKIIPLSDGGEGFVYSLSKILKLRIFADPAFDLLKNRQRIEYLASDSTTYFESASVIGLESVPRSMRNPFNYDSYSLGRLLLEANTKNIVIGLGGSATTDGGLGLLKAMGALFYTKNGNEFKPDIHDILDIDNIDLTEPRKFFKSHNVTVCYDVLNRYTGETGAVYTFARQKGATPKDMEQLEAYLVHLNNIFKKSYDVDLNEIPGSGAAGGLGGAFRILGAKGSLGIDYLIGESLAHKYIEKADIIITGEGQIDSQSLRGKVVGNVARLAVDKKVIAFTGVNKLTKAQTDEMNISEVIEISDKTKTLQYNLVNAKKQLEFSVIRNKKLFI